MTRTEWLDHGAGKVLAVVTTSALVVVGLLNGACGGSAPASGHCWRPGQCREVSDSSQCPAGESFDTGACSDTLRIGTCVGSGGESVHLYAPLHLLTPDCAEYVGAGGHYVAD